MKVVPTSVELENRTSRHNTILWEFASVLTLNPANLKLGANRVKKHKQTQKQANSSNSSFSTAKADGKAPTVQTQEK